jgi:hypothetical protein
VKGGNWELGRGIWEGGTLFIECNAFSFVFDGPPRGIRVVAAGGIEIAVVVENSRVYAVVGICNWLEHAPLWCCSGLRPR